MSREDGSHFIIGLNGSSCWTNAKISIYQWPKFYSLVKRVHSKTEHFSFLLNLYLAVFPRWDAIYISQIHLKLLSLMSLKKKVPKYQQKNANISMLLILNHFLPTKKKYINQFHVVQPWNNSITENAPFTLSFLFENGNCERWIMGILVSLSEVVSTEFRKYWFIDLLILSREIYEYSVCVHKWAVLCWYKQDTTRGLP